MSSSSSRDKFYPNPYKGKEDEITSDFEKQLEKYGEVLLSRLHNSFQRSDDYSVYTGDTGVAYLYWHLFRIGHPSGPNLLQEAKSITKGAIKHLKNRRVSFLCGDAGPLALGIVMTDDEGLRKNYVEKLLSLRDILPVDDGVHEVLYGTAGYLFALLFVQKYCNCIPNKVISELAKMLFKEGWRSQSEPLYYEWHEKMYLGAAHGLSGILYILLKVKDNFDSEEINKIKQTIDWLFDQRFRSGNLRSSVGSPDDRLVQWCHGAPGGIYVALEAYKVFGDESYKKIVERFCEVIWDRGVLTKGYSICHGVAGNAYALMLMYRATHDKVYKKRAFSLAKWCFSYGKKNIKDPDRPLSMFEGIAGVIYMLFDFKSESPCFPCFEL